MSVFEWWSKSKNGHTLMNNFAGWGLFEFFFSDGVKQKNRLILMNSFAEWSLFESRSLFPY